MVSGCIIKGWYVSGYLYDHGHLARAMCCRLVHKEPDISGDLPGPYRVNHPWLGRVTAYDPPRETEKTKAMSINWCTGDSAAEVIDGTKGHVVDRYVRAHVCVRAHMEGEGPFTPSERPRNVNIPRGISRTYKETSTYHVEFLGM